MDASFFFSFFDKKMDASLELQGQPMPTESQVKLYTKSLWLTMIIQIKPCIEKKH